MAERCVCCDLEVGCGKAQEDAKRKEATKRKTELSKRGYKPSQYGGTCAGCSTPYGVGELIKYTIVGYTGECCA